MNVTIVMRRSQVPGVERPGTVAETIYNQELRDDIMIRELLIAVDEEVIAQIVVNRGHDIPTVPVPEDGGDRVQITSGSGDRVLVYQPHDPFLRDETGTPTGYADYEPEGYGDENEPAPAS